MSNGPFDFLPLWGFFASTCAVLGLAIEGGYRFGRWRRKQATDEKEQPVGAIVGSILGLVALVLGFTFSLVATRFEARRQAVLEDANAIGTVHLRARLLPEPQRTEIARLLREYVAVRIEAVRSGNAEGAIARSEALHELLWTQTAAATERMSNHVVAGVFIQSLNELINVHGKRLLVGLQSRIPLVIWIGVFGLALLGMFSVGYQSGLAATRRSPAMIGLVLAFAVVLLLIADLDRAQEGLLRVSQQAMSDLQRTMQPPQP
jgi:hypothetical protein